MLYARTPPPGATSESRRTSGSGPRFRPRPARQPYAIISGSTRGRWRDHQSGSHVHSQNRSTGSVLNYAPGTSPRLLRRHSPWPPDRRHHPIQQFPDTTSLPCVRALQPNPDPPGSSWWFRLEGRSAAGSLSLHLSVLLAGPGPGPGPSGSAGPSRLCQGSHPHPGNHAALSFNQPAATSWRRCPFTTGSRAPRGARCQ